MRYWIFNCRKVYGLVSESMERKLFLKEWMGVRFHLMMCAPCSLYKRQLFFIRTILQDHSRAEAHARHVLPDEARERIEKKILTSMKE